jgi:uncharacterized membrane-anchored protein YhcB (DUF1043 family)
MSGGEISWIWGVGFIAFAFGVAVGIVVSYLLLTQSSRAKQLAEELEQVKAESRQYRAQVGQHFQKTSELFQGMARQYRDVYEHLAGGAQALCGDSVTSPQLDIPETQLLSGAAEPHDAQPDEDDADYPMGAMPKVPTLDDGLDDGDKEGARRRESRHA